jgi:hypothetical protein
LQLFESFNLISNMHLNIIETVARDMSRPTLLLAMFILLNHRLKTRGAVYTGDSLSIMTSYDRGKPVSL